MNEHQSSENRPTPRTSRDIAVVVLILLAALGIRAVNIGNEAAWFDEISTLQHLDSASLSEFITRCKDLNPVPPIFLAAEFFWSRVFGPTVLAQRMLALLLGICSLVALYGLVRFLFDHRSAAFSMAWMALMPWHVFYSQEIRFYGLTVLLTIGAMWSYAAMASAPTPWRTSVNCLLNWVLVWTHPLTAFAIVAQGAHLLLFRRSNARAVVIWFVVNALLAVSLAAFLLGQDLGKVDEVTRWIQPPTITGRESSLQAFGMVAAGAWKVDGSFESAPRWRGGEAAFALYPWLTRLLVAVTLIAAGHTLAVLFRSRSDSRTGPHPGLSQAEKAWLIVLWLLLPPVSLFIVSHVWRPVFTARYLLFATPALYVLMGYWLAARRSIVAATTLALPTALYLAFHFPGPFRMPWDRITAHVQRSAGANSTVFVDVPFGVASFEYYWEGTVPELGTPAELGAIISGDASPSGECWVITGGVGDEIVAELLGERGVVMSHARFASNDRVVAVIGWRP